MQTKAPLLHQCGAAAGPNHCLADAQRTLAEPFVLAPTPTADLLAPTAPGRVRCPCICWGYQNIIDIEF